MNYNIYSGGSIITSVDEGDIEYPYEKEAQLIFKNEGLLSFVNVTFTVHYGLSIQNFSTPPMLTEVKQILFEKPKKKYYELLMRKKGKVSDMANYPNRIIDILIDNDGWCRNVIENIAIKFNHIFRVVIPEYILVKRSSFLRLRKMLSKQRGYIQIRLDMILYIQGKKFRSGINLN